MKILIAGGHSAFCFQLIERLNREKHDVYIISGKKSPDEPPPYLSKRCVDYDFDLTNGKLRFIIDSITPDAIIFMGAVDVNYDWEASQQAAMDYMSGLSNLLVLASILNIPRFVYLSTQDVYGTETDAMIDETVPKAPADLKSLVISEGEDLCLGFNHARGMRSVILRFSPIYGTADSKADFAARLFRQAEKKKDWDFAAEERKNDQYFTPIFMTDAIDAIYKAATKEKRAHDCYNVAGKRVCMSEAIDIVGNMVGLGEPPEESPAETIREASLDTARFEDEFAFRPIVEMQAGLTRTYRAYKKKPQTKKEKTRTKSGFFSAITPFLENILVFALFLGLHYLFSVGSPALSEIDFDFMVLYVLIIAITFGLFQASVAVLLASVVYVVGVAQGAPAFEMLIGINTIVRVLQLLIIGVLTGQAKDRMRAITTEKNEQLELMQSELDSIYQINDSNIKIKQTLNDRLVNYEDSLARIYSVIDKLNSLQVDEIFFSAVEVIGEIMNCSDVSVYIVTTGSFKMCRLAASTPGTGRVHKKSIPLADFPELSASMEKNEVFVNNKLVPELPIMAAPIYSGNQLVAVIMLNAMTFENQTTYTINRFIVLSRLISSVIEKAAIHSQNMRDSHYEEGTNVLRYEAFLEILDVHKRAEKNNTAHYKVIEVSQSDLPFDQLAEKVGGMLRSNDYLGKSERGALYALLANTNDKEAVDFVFKRLEKAGISLKDVAI